MEKMKNGKKTLSEIWSADLRDYMINNDEQCTQWYLIGSIDDIVNGLPYGTFKWVESNLGHADFFDENLKLDFLLGGIINSDNHLSVFDAIFRFER